MKKLNGCIAKNGEEIDGKEFEITTLKELIDILINHKEIHLNYFDEKEDLDLWIRLGDRIK